jgi:transposase
MERGEVVGPERTPRRDRSVAEKRRIVELALQPGVSVARVAQAEGVNANQVFKWRREYRNGQLVEAAEPLTALLPVVVATGSSEACVELSAPVAPTPAASSGVIHIELPGRATISVEHGADRALLQTILESLRK